MHALTINNAPQMPCALYHLPEKSWRLATLKISPQNILGTLVYCDYNHGCESDNK